MTKCRVCGIFTFMTAFNCMAAQAIMFDGDGTAFEHGAQSAPLEIVKALSQLAIPAYLCSGRSFVDGEQIARELGQPRAWLSGGAAAYNIKSGGRILPARYDRFPISHLDAPGIHAFLSELVEGVPGSYVEIPNWDQLVQGVLPTPMLPGFWIDEHVDSIYVRSVADFATAADIASAVEAEFTDYDHRSFLFASVVTAQNPAVYDVHVNSRNGHKGSALKREALLQNIDPCKIVVVGDGYNDIPMFEIAGWSIAMGDAPESVKEAADEVIGTQQEGAFLELLERLRRR